MFKIVAISDTHNRHNKLGIPQCDIFIHCGDWTSMGHAHEVENFAKWLNKINARYIVLVPGNHELTFEKNIPESLNWIKEHCPTAHILIEESIEIEGIKIYGSPITPFFYNWAWNRYRGEDIQKHWNKIPENTDILITHGPPYGILDTTIHADGSPRPENLGCEQLLKKVQEIKPDLHLFGHIHHPGGTQVHKDGTSFYNCSVCNEQYFPSNPLTIIEYDKNLC